MSNKIVLSIIALLLIVALCLTLSDMYISNSGYNGYKLLISATIASILMLLVKEPNSRCKVAKYAISSIFYFLTFILALISLYSSPTQMFEFLTGAVIYLSGSLVFASSFAISSHIKEDSVGKIGTFHKYFRYFLLLLLIVEILNILYAISIMPTYNHSADFTS